MKLLKHVLAFVLCCVLLLSFSVVFASAEPVDETRSCSLTIKANYNGTPVEGMTFSLYRVGAVTGNTPDFSLTEPYGSYPIDPANMDTSSWDDLAMTLRSVVRANEIGADFACTTQADGTASASGLPCGLYLVIGDRITIEKKVYESTPFLVSLPTITNGYLDYAPVALPKLSRSNLKLVNIRVLKIWDDWWYTEDRPTSVTVHLYCDGQEVDSVVLSERCSWRCEWTELSGEKEWTISEDYVKDYTVTIRQNGDRYMITNRYDKPAPDGFYPSPAVTLPQTGLVQWPVIAFGALGLILVLVGLVSLRLRSLQPAEGQRTSGERRRDEE